MHLNERHRLIEIIELLGGSLLGASRHHRRSRRPARLATRAMALSLAALSAAGCGGPEGFGDVSDFTDELATTHLSGAIFTTTVDGTVVNENVHYQSKPDVYLDGGPGPRAPVGAAGLPEGDYFFQVTNPNGRDLLSTDHLQCRKLHVNAAGVISAVIGSSYRVSCGRNCTSTVPCPLNNQTPAVQAHNVGTDADHAADGAITVQLFPFDDTPNAGGVYKVWITRIADFGGDSNYIVIDSGPLSKRVPLNGENLYSATHGFVPASSKTDNFKVDNPTIVDPYVAPIIVVKKFEDLNGDGQWNSPTDPLALDHEPEIGVESSIDISGILLDAAPDLTGGSGWPFSITDPLGVTNGDYTGETPATIIANLAGNYVISERTFPNLWTSTRPESVTVSIAGTSGEEKTAVFGNFRCFDVSGRKIDDINGNAEDDGEPGVSGWGITLSRNGSVVGTTNTGADGSYSFHACDPGTYTVSEASVEGWVPMGPTDHSFGARSGEPHADLSFLNFHCYTVSGAKYRDLNGDGAYSAGEPGIAGTTISLVRAGATVQTTTTDANGAYSFEVCDAGPHAVEDGGTANCGATSPTSLSYTGSSGRDVSNLNFFCFECFDITVTKFYDANKDRAYAGANECTLAGWSFNVLVDGVSYGAIVTDASGLGSAQACLPGTYSIVEESRAGWTQTSPNVSFAAVSGQSRSIVFGNVKPFLGSLTIGYWGTHTACGPATPIDPLFTSVCSLDSGLVGAPIILGISGGAGYRVIDGSKDVADTMNNPSCDSKTRCIPQLQAQLLAAKLNVRRFPGFESALLSNGTTVGRAIAEADRLLGLTRASTTENTQAAALLDTANNNHQGTTLVEDICP